MKLRTTSIERLFIKPKVIIYDCLSYDLIIFIIFTLTNMFFVLLNIFQIIWDWALTEDDRSNEVVRVAFNIDVEAINEDDNDIDESNFKDACMKKVKMNGMEIISTKKYC